MAPSGKNKNETLFSKRSGVDRRSLVDRRQVYSIDYFIQGGVERRCGAERRKNHMERRKGWVRVNDWISVPVQNH